MAPVVGWLLKILSAPFMLPFAAMIVAYFVFCFIKAVISSDGSI